MVNVRSYAVATYIVGRGYRPIEIDTSGPFFSFDDEAQGAFNEYMNSRRILDGLVAERQFQTGNQAGNQAQAGAGA